MSRPVWHYAELGSLHTACGLSRAFNFDANHLLSVTCTACLESDMMLALGMERALAPDLVEVRFVVDDDDSPGVPIPDEITEPTYPKVRRR